VQKTLKSRSIFDKSYSQILHFHLDHSHNLVIRSSAVDTLTRPLTRSSLKITNCCFRYATTLHFLHGMNSPLNFASLVRCSLLHLHPHGSSPSSLSSLASPLTHSVFYSDLKTWLFGGSFPLYIDLSLPIPDWLHGFSDHLTFLCSMPSTAGFVCMVC